MKYNEKNYNRLKKHELYDFPPVEYISVSKRKSKIMSRSGKVKRIPKRSMEWMEDLLAK